MRVTDPRGSRCVRHQVLHGMMASATVNQDGLDLCSRCSRQVKEFQDREVFCPKCNQVEVPATGKLPCVQCGRYTESLYEVTVSDKPLTAEEKAERVAPVISVRMIPPVGTYPIPQAEAERIIASCPTTGYVQHSGFRKFEEEKPAAEIQEMHSLETLVKERDGDATKMSDWGKTATRAAEAYEPVGIHPDLACKLCPAKRRGHTGPCDPEPKPIPRTRPEANRRPRASAVERTTRMMEEREEPVDPKYTETAGLVWAEVPIDQVPKGPSGEKPIPKKETLYKLLVERQDKGIFVGVRVKSRRSAQNLALEIKRIAQERKDDLLWSYSSDYLTLFARIVRPNVSYRAPQPPAAKARA